MPPINRVFLVLVLTFAAIPLAQLAGATLRSSDVTVLEGVIPTEARPGDVVTVTGFALDTLSTAPVLAKAGDAPAAGGFSEPQGFTLSGWLMLAPGIIVSVVVLYLAVTAPLWRKRHLNHW
jgi:hypothetical protein